MKHCGRWVDKDNGSLGVEQLRGMRANTQIMNFGIQLEYFPMYARDFTATVGGFGPFISLGTQISYYDPKTYSLMGPLGTTEKLFPII